MHYLTLLVQQRAWLKHASMKVIQSVVVRLAD